MFEFLFDLLALSDLHHNRIDAEHPPAAVLDRVVAGDEMAEDAWLTRHHPALFLVQNRLAGLDHAAKNRFDRVDHLRYDLAHRASHVLFHRSAVDLRQTLVDAEKSQIGVYNTEADWGRGVYRLDLRQLAARLLLALAPRFLGPLAFGDVNKSSDRQDPAAFRIIDRRRIYREEALRPVAAPASYLLAFDPLSGGERAGEGILFRPIGTAVLAEGAESRVSLIVVRERHRVARQRLRFAVVENQTARRRFGDGHANGHLFKNLP